MRKIAIVGSGQAGLQLAFGLLRHGYAVTLYSDRTPEEILNGRVPATAFIFDRGPITPAAKEVLLAGTRHPGIAAEFFDDFNDPRNFWPRVEDLGEARRYVAEKTGAPWLKTAALARAAIAGGQMKRKLGLGVEARV